MPLPLRTCPSFHTPGPFSVDTLNTENDFWRLFQRKEMAPDTHVAAACFMSLLNPQRFPTGGRLQACGPCECWVTGPVVGPRPGTGETRLLGIRGGCLAPHYDGGHSHTGSRGLKYDDRQPASHPEGCHQLRSVFLHLQVRPLEASSLTRSQRSWGTAWG